MTTTKDPKEAPDSRPEFYRNQTQQQPPKSKDEDKGVSAGKDKDEADDEKKA